MARMAFTLEKHVAAGLLALERPPDPQPAFRTTGFDLGPSLVGNLDNVGDVLARVEGQGHRRSSSP